MRREFLQSLQADAGAGHQPGRVLELLRNLPRRTGPDVLGMRRHAPRQAAQGSGIARDRGRRVQEMGVEPVDRGRQLGRQHQRLAPAPHPVGGGVAPEIGQEFPACQRIARQATRLPPALEHAARIVLEILRQIDDTAGDAIVHGMAGLVRGPAQRPDFQRDATGFEAGDFLGNEGLGKARPAFQHDRDTRANFDGHEQPVLRSWRARAGRRANRRRPSAQRLPRPRAGPDHGAGS